MENLDKSVPTNTRSKRRDATQVDVKTGDIFVILANDDGRPMKIKMYMKVFKNAQEHHAQIFAESDHRHPFGFISLRKCTFLYDEQTMTISIASKKTTFKGLSFEARTVEEVHSWMELLSPSCDPAYDSDSMSSESQSLPDDDVFLVR